jgi:uncharacterized protein (TIGR03435 family)
MLKTAVAAIYLLLAWGLGAQTGPAPLTFEVASIKSGAPDTPGTMFQMQPDGGVRIVGATLRTLIAFAYDVRDFQISGGPGWINSDRFDIVAHAERSSASQSAPADPFRISDSQRAQTLERLRSLLAERFQLTVHHDNKEQTVYALVVAKSGPKLPEAKAGNISGRMRMGRGQLDGQGVEMKMLATVLSNQVGRPVIDRTALKGEFDVKLEWTPDPGQGGGPFGPLGPPPPGIEPPPPPDPNGPSIFTALQEQLGLRLESQKGPAESLVIDRVQRPSEN